MQFRRRLLLHAALLAPAAGAQTVDTVVRAPRTTVSGVVRDSATRVPLAGAVVQLVTAGNLARGARSALSDSLGRFTIGDVPAGRYVLGFFHPILDSLGLGPTVRELVVDATRPVHADLATPTPERIRTASCGNGPDPGGVVIGVVRGAEDRAPLVGITVTAEWLEYSITPRMIGQRTSRVTGRTASNGWFALCDLPSLGTVVVTAGRGADSTDRIEVQLPATHLARRDLYIGPSRIDVTRDGMPGADSLVRPPIRRRVGDGRLSGVVTGDEARPLANALVSLQDGPQTRANVHGEWTIVGAPLGTRVLEIRAVGYYPERRAVDVVAGAPPVHSALSTMEAMLDTVHITASRLTNVANGFEARRRSGIGKYLTPEDIAQRRPFLTSELFTMVPGLFAERVAGGETQIRMRGTFSARCSPEVYIDGHAMAGLTADDIDDWVHPDEVAGIEIYPGASVPPQFTRSMMSDCGSIVIWTKPRLARATQASWKVRAMEVTGLAAFGLLMAAGFAHH